MGIINPEEYEDRLDEEYEPAEELDEEILDGLYKQLSEQNTKRVNSQDILRSDLMSFLSKQMDNVDRENNLKAMIEKDIAQKIALHQFDSNQIMMLYRTVNENKANNIRAITDIFKPTNNAPNVMLNPPSSTNNNQVTELSSEQLQTLDKLAKLLPMLGKQQ